MLASSHTHQVYTRCIMLHTSQSNFEIESRFFRMSSANIIAACPVIKRERIKKNTHEFGLLTCRCTTAIRTLRRAGMKRQPKTAPHWCCIRPRKSFNKQGNSKKSPYTHRIPKISEKVNSQWMRPKKNRSKPHTFALCSKCLIKKTKTYLYICASRQLKYTFPYRQRFANAEIQQNARRWH